MNKIKRPSKYVLGRAVTTTLRSSLNLISRIDFLISPQGNLIRDYPQNIIAEKIVVYVCFKELSKRDKEILALFESMNWRVINIVNTFEVAPARENTFFRKNLGYDFGAYRDAIVSIKECKKLLLVNSSMIWNLRSLRDLLKSFDHDILDADVLYLTESVQVRKHGQSYFIYLNFSKGNFSIHDLSDFFQNKIRNTRLKRTAVLYGEFGIFDFFMTRKLKVGFLCTYEKLRSTYIGSSGQHKEDWVNKLLLKGVHLNPTQHLWWVAYDLGVPGIKKSLLAQNPAGLIIDNKVLLNKLDLQ